MKKGGKPTISLSIHKERGTLRPSRHNKGVQSRSVDFIPTAPETLNEEGARVWYEFFSYAIEIEGYLAKTEIGLIELACQAWQEYRDLLKVVTMEGFVVESHNGIQMINPNHKLMTAAQDRYLKIMREMGMTPTTRSGVSLMQDKPKGDFDDL